MECLANYTIQECDCAPFHMPRNKTTQICGFDKMDCYQKAEESILMTKGNNDIESSKDSPHGKCNCMPACTAIQYDTEISQTSSDFDHYFHAIGLPKEVIQ